jgi:ABC-2 type transport system ATP-binding protein
MKQKLALTRTLLHRPNLILLDEPTAGLDVQSAVAIREDLVTLVSKEEVTIFLTTHNMTDAEKLCDQVAIINKGRLLVEGSPTTLRESAGASRVEVLGYGFKDKALDLLRNHPQVKAVQSHNNHLMIDVVVETPSSDLVSILVRNGAQIEEVRRSKASLEDVYLQVIGEQND